MTNLEAIQLKHSLERINLPGLKLNYAIVKNLGKLEAEIKLFESLTRQSEGFEGFEKERIGLAEKHAKKNEVGEPIVDGNRYVIESLDKFNHELKLLQEANREEIEGRQKQLSDYAKFLEEQCQIEIHKVSVAQLPENITTQEMRALAPMLGD